MPTTPIALSDELQASQEAARSLCTELRRVWTAGAAYDAAGPLIGQLQRSILLPIPRESAPHEAFRIAAVQCGITEVVAAFLAGASNSIHQRDACRAIRGLTGSVRNISSNIAASSALTPACITAIVRICREYSAHAPVVMGGDAPSQLDVLEQAVGALMNSLRPPECTALRHTASRCGVVPAVAVVLSFALDRLASEVDAPHAERLAMFSCYALLAMARDPLQHHAFSAEGVIPTVKRAAGVAPLALRAVGTMILAPLSASFDDPADSISLDVPAVRFITTTLEHVLDPSFTGYVGWKLGELVHALFSISATDTLKSLLVDVDALPLLLRVLEDPEHTAAWTQAISAISNLTMHASDEQRVRNMTAIAMPSIQTRLEALTRSAAPDVAKQAAAILTVTALANSSPAEAADTSTGAGARPFLRARSSLGRGVEEVRLRRATLEGAGGDPLASDGEADDDSSEPSFDVMISYCWASKRTVLRMRDGLVAAGVRVWLDEDHMGRDLMDSMASAVESSKCVIVCCSSAYKTSPNCRREATYAAHLSKPIIVANMEHEYVARGWLGMHIAGKIWADFRDEDDACFRRGMGTLFKQLVEVGAMTRAQLSHGAAGRAPSARNGEDEPSGDVADFGSSAKEAPASPRLPSDYAHTRSKDRGTEVARAAVETLEPAALTLDLPSSSPWMRHASSVMTGKNKSQEAGQPVSLPRAESAPSGSRIEAADGSLHPASLHATAAAPPSMPQPERNLASRTAPRDGLRSRTRDSIIGCLRDAGHVSVADAMSSGCSDLALRGLTHTLERDPTAFHNVVCHHLRCSLFDSMALAEALWQVE